MKEKFAKVQLELRIHQEQAEHRLSTKIAALELETLYIRRDRTLAEHQIYTSSASSLRRKPLQHLFPVKSIEAAIREKEVHLELTRLRCDIVAILEQEIVTIQQFQKKYESELSFLERERAKGAVRASSPGMVVTQDMSLKVGEYVNAGDGIVQIAQTDEWKGTILIAERDRPKITPGLSARVYLQAFPHQDYRIIDGTVHSVGQTAIHHPGDKGVAYPVSIRISDPWIIDKGDTLSLAQGMSIDARIVVEEGTIHQILKKRFLQTVGSRDRVDLFSAILRN